MRVFGIAAAITGNHEDVVDLTCTTISIHHKSRSRVDVTKYHSFRQKLDMADEYACDEAYIKLADAVSYTVLNQQLSFQASGYEYRPVAICLGKDGRKSYNYERFIERVFGREDIITQNERLIEAHAKMALAMPQCRLKLSAYVKKETAPGIAAKVRESLEKGQNLINNRLVELKPKLDAKNPEALRELIAIAVKRAKDHAQIQLGLAQKHSLFISSENIFRSDEAPWPNYWQEPQLQAKYPLYCFTTWHPAIHQAFVETLTNEMGIHSNFYFKPASEKPSPFYVDVVSTMLQNQLDYALGDRQENDVLHDEPFWRTLTMQKSFEIASESGYGYKGR